MDKFFVTVLKVKNNTNNSFNSIVIIGAAWYLSRIVLVYLLVHGYSHLLHNDPQTTAY